MTGEIFSLPFLIGDQNQEIFRKVMKFYSKLRPGPNNLFYLGSPIYINQMFKRDEGLLKVQEFNVIMEAYFSDLLEKIKDRLTEYYQDEFSYHPDLSYPGFHVLEVPPESEKYFNFHRDEEYSFVAGPMSELKLNSQFGSRSFTVLLSRHSDCDDGLLYVENLNGVNEKGINPEQLKSMSSLYSYSVGDMVIHGGYLHALYTKNRSKELRHRITLQGHFVKTSKGFVIFW